MSDSARMASAFEHPSVRVDRRAVRTSLWCGGRPARSLVHKRTDSFLAAWQDGYWARRPAASKTICCLSSAFSPH
jgi:hypothetical protein